MRRHRKVEIKDTALANSTRPAAIAEAKKISKIPKSQRTKKQWKAYRKGS